jgi:hypothetical protein
MYNNRSIPMDQMLNKLSKLNMNSVYIKYLVKKLKKFLSFHLKQNLVEYLNTFSAKRKETPKPKSLIPQGLGPQILTTKELNESTLLDSPISENSINHEKTFSNEEEIIMDRKIRKFVLETSKQIFQEWFKEKTLQKEPKTNVGVVKQERKRKRGRRLKRMDDL